MTTCDTDVPSPRKELRSSATASVHPQPPNLGTGANVAFDLGDRAGFENTLASCQGNTGTLPAPPVAVTEVEGDGSHARLRRHWPRGSGDLHVPRKVDRSTESEPERFENLCSVIHDDGNAVGSSSISGSSVAFRNHHVTNVQRAQNRQQAADAHLLNAACSSKETFFSAKRRMLQSMPWHIANPNIIRLRVLDNTALASPNVHDKFELSRKNSA